jgi:hypothetical protein
LYFDKINFQIHLPIHRKMATILNTSDISALVSAVRQPSIVVYNRLSPNPRSENIAGSLRAEIRDPLWMLTRQWQLGEFQGEDTGTPVTARIGFQHQNFDRVGMGQNAIERFNAFKTPLEVTVENERLPLSVRTAETGFHGDLMFGLQISQRFSDTLEIELPVATNVILKVYTTKYAIKTTSEDEEAGQIAMAIAEEVPDGCALLSAIVDGSHAAWLTGLAFSDAEKTTLTQLTDKLRIKFEAKLKRIFSPSPNELSPAWKTEQLEYAFDIATPMTAEGKQTILTADQYVGGTLDWYSFDLAERNHAPLSIAGEIPTNSTPAIISESFIPTPMQFRGMPQPRFWQMEESKLDFGKIDVSTNSMLAMLLAEFGLVYGNDWFVLPHPMKINDLCEIMGLVITDTFGFHTSIKAAGRGVETNWQRWAMFHLTERGNTTDMTHNLFYLPPVVNKTLESEPLDAVNFLRDEMANMAWGVETTVPSQIGKGMSAKFKSDISEETTFTPIREDLRIRYELGRRVPKNWIPLIPVRMEGSDFDIRLQRGRVAGGVPARTEVLGNPTKKYFINEEEVPRSGAIVERRLQRSRWLNGKTFVWMGRQKQTGRGEGSSQLGFDLVNDLPNSKV